MNVASLLVRAAGCAGDRVAVQHGTTTVATYSQLADRVTRLARGLADELGLHAGDRVALVMTNCPDYVDVLFAIWHAGLVAVPMNAKLHAMEFDFMLDDAGASVCLVTPDKAATVAEAPSVKAGQVRLVEVGSAGYTRLLQAEPLPMVERDQDDMAWLFYTSGTTGKPKGAMLSNRNLLTMTACYALDVDAVTPDDGLLHAAPMSHGSGFYILPHVAATARQVIPESGGFDPAEILALLPRQPNLSFFAAPTMVSRLVSHPGLAEADTGNLKTIVYGGGPRYVADARAAMEALGPKIAQIYGQGESPMCITAMNKAQHADTGHPRHKARLASVGQRQALVDVRVGDPSGRALPPGESGEVMVRGPAVMLGYWRNRDATAKTIRDGWLYTGDVGALDADGYLTLMDRSKDVIISGGTNIYPREVEEVLLTHPGVREVSVVGRPHADWGEEVVAFVVTDPAVSPDMEPTPEALDSLCLASIARFKRPKDYRYLPELPKNNYGKVLKTDLRRLLTDDG
ncbi:Long-chain-fatty-acid--CoA ligase [Caenispirillum salinarum AK4]|uniref:Long-chain-fatty-acid--CoA ligase n=1 Tax=Caenispirillum salinarum AK4 TaxID=1238182 RepID=K9GQU2_9PROT|nr:AMP-binding protein [Caenispirillum salinarum]EKV27527.1 Long-chain-fatty-acid--CoA ligase [Caenispirillum salinarum AK4]